MARCGGVLGPQMTLAEFSAAKVEPHQTNIQAATYGQIYESIALARRCDRGHKATSGS